MPAVKLSEFRRGAVELARQREESIAQIAHDLGIVETYLRLGMLTHTSHTVDEEGVNNLSLTVELDELLTMAHVPYALISHALNCFERRRHSPHQGRSLA